MNISEAIHARIAYRSLEHIKITKEMRALTAHAQLNACALDEWAYHNTYQGKKLIVTAK